MRFLLLDLQIVILMKMFSHHYGVLKIIFKVLSLSSQFLSSFLIIYNIYIYIYIYIYITK